MSWTPAFTDSNLTDHRLYTSINSDCSSATDHGLTGSNTTSNTTVINGLTDGIYYGQVRGIDAGGLSVLSDCSTETIIVDLTDPVDNTGTGLVFVDVASATGNDISVDWADFTETNFSDHRLYTYTNSICSTGEIDHGLTGSPTSADAAIIDGLTDGVYYGKVAAIDIVGRTVASDCSTDSIMSIKQILQITRQTYNLLMITIPMEMRLQSLGPLLAIRI